MVASEASGPVAGGARSSGALSRLPAALRPTVPGLLLVLSSITFAEFLTGSTPVLTPLLDPVSLLFLLGLYGAGVLLVREASVRWQKGWPTVLLLGAAYGIVEEAIGTKTFFGPAGVGYLGVFGHFAGVNWVWAVELALFHAVYSIALPIAVVALVFPGTRGRSFLATARSRGFVLAVFALTVAAMFLLFNPSETPGAPLLVGALAAVGLLVLAGRLAPRGLADLRFGRAAVRSGVAPFALGVLFVVGFFGLAWVGPRLLPVPAAIAAGLLLWCVGFGVYLARHREGFEAPRSRLDLILGCLSFLLVLAFGFGVAGDYGAIPVAAIVVVVGWRLRGHLSAPLPASAPLGAVGDGSAS
ncbi:MAG TPA: hypothetical protein VGP88_03100 [Thermoplasmata archaeon]|nr:hypothetical protein [Thermoplasmata archaeon]